MGCRESYYYDENCGCYPWTSLTADIGALAGLSLTYLCAPSHALRRSSSCSQPLPLLGILR